MFILALMAHVAKGLPTTKQTAIERPPVQLTHHLAEVMEEQFEDAQPQGLDVPVPEEAKASDENEIEQDQLQKGGSRGPRSSHYQISEDTTRHNETFWYRVKLPPDVACRK